MAGNRSKILMGVGFLAIAVGALFYFFMAKGIIALPMMEENNVVSGDSLVSYSSINGFSPEALVVKSGSKIFFVNNGPDALWVGSDLHPTHAVYPGSHIEKCATVEEFRIFDSCRNIPSGSVWLFTFNEVGIWGYHNHLRPGHVGTIQVVE